MNNKRLKWLAGGLLGLMAVFGLGSCSDDHYDLKSTNASSTLYENVVATNECDSFLMIISRSIVDKKSYGTPATLTYGELLKGTKMLTVWAPKDGTYNAKKWLDMLTEAENYDAAGDRTTAADLYQEVEKQFSQNHLSYFNYTGSYATSSRISLANGKYAVYDVAENTIKGVQITTGATQNIASTNGTVHLLESYIPYAYDLKEVFDFYDELSAMRDYVYSRDTLIFQEEQSTPGATVDGEVQYVDSVFEESNTVMPSIASNADSLAAAIYFTNDVWNNAVEYVKTFYQYREKYPYLDESNNLYNDSVNADSLQETNAVKAIFDNMYYSLYEQPGFDVDNASVESVKNFFETADSLVSTETYNRGHLYHQHAPECNTLTDNETPIEVSNGYVFIVNNFNFKARLAWQYDLTYQMEGGRLLSTQNSRSLSTASPYGVEHTVTEGNRNSTIIGTVSEGVYQ